MIVQLDGGNDGLNTFIPYTDNNYFQLRPTIAIQNGIPISSEVALHPNMNDLKTLYDQGRLAIIQNVSYPNPNLSHFRSRDIWMSARPEGTADSGWIARYLTTLQAETGDAVFLGDEYPLTLLGENREQYLHLAPGLSVKLSGKLAQAVLSLYDVPQENPKIEELRQAVVKNRQAIDKVAQNLGSRTGYPNTDIGNRFALASAILASQPKVLCLTVGGWDTHNDQLNRQGNLLRQVSQSLGALQNDLQNSGLADNVLILVFSEFGRRPAQNGTAGTDHGTGGPVMVLGNVRGGIYGGQPPLDSLVAGNLPVINDFRSIYAEILRNWEGVNPEVALGQDFPALGFL
ncbi:DUF1501 domain-containing protein [Iningainema tapete]|uniref:DUF1501 domain-containing protein n=1 Tax=Iningainema tapete BLCC-T55 TaxID=2748662 RepID=A0A8J7CBQ3_9CYAN|nr:DUF1501 domain-containing protein [Iningainema tapete]MBD2771885.1 DUF1501 domain-containing protein [Iningainema tapete BLCC-T55]